MKTIKLITAITAFVILTTGCNNKKETTSLRFDWFTSMTFSGEVWAFKEFAEKNNLNLKLEPGSESTDPIKLVIGGANDFGCISVERFLIANEKGADLVAVGVINQLSPTVFVSKKEKNILTPKDWIGKQVGVLPGGATEYVYRSLLKKQGLNSAQFTELTVPFDLGTFVADKYDVRPAFVYDEPVFLESQNIPYDIIEPKNYGVNYVGRVYFAKRSFVDKNPEIVQRFVNSMADGWSNSLKNPKVAIDKLKAFEPNTDTSRDLKSLTKAIPYYLDEDDKVLTFNYTYWDETIKELIDLGIIKENNYRKYINESFIKKYYEKK